MAAANNSETSINGINNTIGTIDNDSNFSTYAFDGIKEIENRNLYQSLLVSSYELDVSVFAQKIRTGANTVVDRRIQDKNLVDIVLDYSWNIQSLKEVDGKWISDGVAKNVSSSDKHNGLWKKGDNISMYDPNDNLYEEMRSNYKGFDIPFCYVTQYRQALSSNIMNIINSISGGVTQVSTLINDLGTNGGQTLSKVSKVVNKLQKALFSGEENSQPSDDSTWHRVTSTVVNNAQTAFKAVWDEVHGGLDRLIQDDEFSNPAYGTMFLQPYKWLYALKPTGKKYCFPMIANPPTQTIQNNFGDGQDGSGLLNNNIFNGAVSMMQNAVGLIRDVRDVIQFFGGNLSKGGYIGSSIEKAKFFNYPTNTQEYRVTFPLLNTVRPNDWKKNFKFIILFMLRNLIFRQDSASYYPPLFYDLVIPGVIRQPFCYVGKFEVRPVGNVRTLAFNEEIIHGFSEAKPNFSVNVPQAWIVTITFTSLLPTSANMVLSGLYDLQISTSQGETESE